MIEDHIYAHQLTEISRSFTNLFPRRHIVEGKGTFACVHDDVLRAGLDTRLFGVVHSMFLGVVVFHVYTLVATVSVRRRETEVVFLKRK